MYETPLNFLGPIGGNQTHLQIMEIDQLAYPDDFFDLAFGNGQGGCRSRDRRLRAGPGNEARWASCIHGTARPPGRAARTPGIWLDGGWGMLDWGREEKRITRRATGRI